MRSELIIVALISACGAPSSGTDAGTTGDAGTSSDAGVLVGTFQLLHLVGDGTNPSASLFGKVYDGATPQSLIWEVDTRDGDCELQTPRVPFCATPCGGSAVCVENDTCAPYPTSKGVGTAHVSGVLASSATFDMTPIVNGYQPPASVTLSVPPFADGAAVSISSDAFVLNNVGVAPIALTSTNFTLQSGAAFDLAWTPGAPATAARVKVKLDISHHGGTRGQLLCDTDDDGSLSISGALITRLISLGVAGFPSVIVRRQRVRATGRVEFVVGSELEHFVTLPGLVSCTDDSECTLPQTCQTDLTCK
jgi:hypothetical protein